MSGKVLLACLVLVLSLSGCVEVVDNKTFHPETIARIYAVHRMKSAWELRSVSYIDDNYDYGEYVKVFLYMYKKDEPWEWTCGYIWIKRDGRVYKDETHDKEAWQRY